MKEKPLMCVFCWPVLKFAEYNFFGHSLCAMHFKEHRQDTLEQLKSRKVNFIHGS